MKQTTVQRNPIRNTMKPSYQQPILFSQRALVTTVVAFACLLSSAAFAQSGLLEGGWQLDSASSSLRFQSIKAGSIIETSRFTEFDGAVDQNGQTTLTIDLNSVDTNIDIRNERMRSMFFDTAKFPSATVTARVEQETLDRLASEKRISLPVEFELDLHGLTKTLTVDTVLTLFADDQISITSVSPVTISASDFSLMDGLAKLQDAAKIEIVPSGSVTFDLNFKRN